MSVMSILPETPLLVVMGNKVDLSDKREISYEEGQTYAESINAHFYEISTLSESNCMVVLQNSIDAYVE